MKRHFLAFAALWCCSVVSVTAQQTINEGPWRITFDATTKLMNVSYDGNDLLTNVYAEARQGEQLLQTTSASAVTMAEADVDDCFGTGRCYTFTYAMQGGAQLLQTLSFYDEQPYFVAQLLLTSPGGNVSSNYVAPLVTKSTAVFLPEDRKNRMLWVPFDNDGFISYQSNYLRRESNSYAVSAIYNTETRQGLVCGAVDHDRWKSAVHMVGTDYYKLSELSLISGYTDAHSHDTLQTEGVVVPHGAVVADTVASSRFMVGYFADWRAGMETFGQACTRVAPRREWAGGVPYGWSSWGVMETKVSYQGIIDVADFIRDNLVEHGFHDQQGRVLLSLDAWWNDNLSTAQIKQFVAYCKANNMIPGLYYGSFCRFGGLDDFVPGTNNRYRFRDIALKQGGRYKVVDGAYCLDPTHPGTKMFMMSDMNKFKQWGIEYLKCDFMSNGIIEADSWYNPNCHTGVQAYNEGMEFLMTRAGDGIFLNLSIAPAFPYQYTHGRRISCDAWGSMDHTKYVMNNTSYGWWLNQVYLSCDPDHLVMKAHGNGGSESDGVNRARLTSGVVTGAFLTGDNFSDNVDRGYPEKSRQQALKLLTIDDINEIPRTCHAFRPVYGNADPAVGCENFMTYENDRYVYLAVFSYKMLNPVTTEMSFADLDIAPQNVKTIKELWTGETVTPTATGFKMNCPALDARIYRLEKADASGISTAHVTSDPAATAIYNLQGQRLSGTPCKGIYIQNGQKHIIR